MRTCLSQHVVKKAIRVARTRTPVLCMQYARICHACACGLKHACACGLALVLTPTKGREPLPGMAYNAYTECDTLLSLSIMHSWLYHFPSQQNLNLLIITDLYLCIKFYLQIHWSISRTLNAAHLHVID